MELLLDVARRHGYTKLALGDHSDRVATRMLANIAKGRGATLTYDTVSGKRLARVSSPLSRVDDDTVLAHV